MGWTSLMWIAPAVVAGGALVWAATRPKPRSGARDQGDSGGGWMPGPSDYGDSTAYTSPGSDSGTADNCDASGWNDSSSDSCDSGGGDSGGGDGGGGGD